jgi:hypothetical protein
MQADLAEILITRGILLTGMEIESRYDTSTFDGAGKVSAHGGFMIQEIMHDDENNIEFLTVSVKDGHKRNITVESVLTIDGMDPDRFAAVYDIQSDGSNKAVGKRRGRKPKNRNV